jgi:apolipoprotein D and lipocalin family protein
LRRKVFEQKNIVKIHCDGAFGMIYLKALFFFSLVTLGACRSSSSFGPIRTAQYVDLSKFAGDWYVIGNIPTFIETSAYNAVESYAEPIDGKVATTFTFNKGSLTGSLKTYTPTGFVTDGTGNAVWGMQFFWPIKAEYRIVYVSDDYGMTIIGRTKRDFVWLMARQPDLSETHYNELLQIIEEEGYDLSKVRRVPHSVNR